MTSIFHFFALAQKGPRGTSVYQPAANFFFFFFPRDAASSTSSLRGLADTDSESAIFFLRPARAFLSPLLAVRARLLPGPRTSLAPKEPQTALARSLSLPFSPRAHPSLFFLLSISFFLSLSRPPLSHSQPDPDLRLRANGRLSLGNGSARASKVPVASRDESIDISTRLDIIVRNHSYVIYISRENTHTHTHIYKK